LSRPAPVCDCLANPKRFRNISQALPNAFRPRRGYLLRISLEASTTGILRVLQTQTLYIEGVNLIIAVGTAMVVAVGAY
jgi:hypothetical protein